MAAKGESADAPGGWGMVAAALLNLDETITRE